jgi:Leucine-rich repeat (LRR) protein
MIDNNDLTGPIPSLLGKLDDITHLSMSNNMLTGSIPSELGKCFRLKELLVNSNQLEGEIPPELGQLDQLQKFQLEDNSIIGVSMPPQVCALRKLDLKTLVADCAEQQMVVCECCSQC